LRPLRRSLLIEQAVVVVVGVLLGVVAGIVAGQLSLSLLPEFPPGRQGPVLPTSVGTGVAAAVAAAAVVLILLLVGGIVASLLTMRRVRPEDVRSST
jgi:ABC-type antimicrobial peptide transport system permease subunit